MDYDDLSKEELLKILKVKDKKIQEKDEFIDLLISEKEDFIDFIADISVDKFDTDALNFDSVLMDSEESDNSQEVRAIEKEFNDIVNKNTSCIDEINNSRQTLFALSVNKVIQLAKNKIEFDIDNFFLPSFLNMEYSEYHIHNRHRIINTMKDLIEHISIEDYYNLFDFKQDSLFLDSFKKTTENKKFELFDLIFSEKNYIRDFVNLNQEEKKEKLISIYSTETFIFYEKYLLNNKFSSSEQNYKKNRL